MAAGADLPAATGAPSAGDFRQKKKALLDGLREARSGLRGARRGLAQLSRLADTTLTALWRQAGWAPDAALVAVGGFGRGELYPQSDVDVLLLLPATADPTHDAALRQRVERFISSCWDAGLEIGSSVRTVSECVDMARADISVQTALLEARLICGSRALFDEFRHCFLAALDSLEFFTAKRLEMRQRHTKSVSYTHLTLPTNREV